MCRRNCRAIKKPLISDCDGAYAAATGRIGAGISATGNGAITISRCATGRAAGTDKIVAPITCYTQAAKQNK